MLTTTRLATALLVALVSAGGLAACSGGSDAVTDVSASEAVEVLAQPGITVIDVRTPAEYSSGHLPGAINLDVDGGSFDAQIAELPKDDTYFVYCQSGNRSGVATDQLSSLGFTTVYDLQGGIADWQASGGTVVTS